MFEEYSVVRIVKLNIPNRRFDGTAAVMESPKVGDVGTIVHIVEQAIGRIKIIYIVEKVDFLGQTVWLADFHQDEIELLVK